MDQSVLHKYFQGEASYTEEQSILKWIDASAENRKIFLKERMLYDVALFANDKQLEKKKKNRMMPVLKWSASIAASIVILWSVGLIFENYNYSKAAQLQTITVSPAQRAQITLADGTKVWLNSKSTLKYAADFGRDNRIVELDGEAYFEVVKNSGTPFYVNTEYNKVRVIGTSFNVCAYKGTSEFETTLVEGVVDIYAHNSEELITRLQKDEFFGAYGGQHKKTVLPSYEFLRWKEGLYCFDDQPFKCVLDKLEKYYSVKFIIENTSVLDYHCTGKFKEQDGVEHILRTIQRDHKFTYVVNGEKTIIRIK